jgi:(R,R)-butanediol dehydrogenase/meso-butanediol dehydrogenase/diacetyl reductase
MRGLVWHGASDLRLEEVPEPPAPRQGEVTVAVAYCGICGTDLQEYAQGPVMIRLEPHPLTGQAPPLILGHEFSGRVSATGPDVDTVRVGDRVTVDPCWRCGRCYWCLRGDYHICRLGGSVGLASDGALAPSVRVQAAGVVPLPDTVDDRAAALTEPLAVGLHAVGRGGVGLGDKILVLGFGPVGAAVLLAAQVAGAGQVFVSEPAEDRRQKSLELGATEAFDPKVTDIRREVYLRTERMGPDVVLDCTGLSDVVPLAVESARRGGRTVIVGVGHGRAPIEPMRLVLLEREIVGSLGYNHDLPRVVELIAVGRIDPAVLITDVVPLEEAIDGAFDALLKAPGKHVKILVDVGGA